MNTEYKQCALGCRQEWVYFPQRKWVSLCEEGTHWRVAVAYQVVTYHCQRHQIMDVFVKENKFIWK